MAAFILLDLYGAFKKKKTREAWFGVTFLFRFYAREVRRMVISSYLSPVYGMAYAILFIRGFEVFGRECHKNHRVLLSFEQRLTIFAFIMLSLNEDQ